METFAPSNAPAHPPKIRSYAPVRCLGAGGQGQVWLMAPDDGSAPVAAKILGAAAKGGSHPSDSERHNASQITQEWRVLSQLRHEHLIAVHRLLIDEEGAAVLLMEHAAGGSLAQLVRHRGALSVGEAVTVLTPMGQALAFLHGKGAVHGDVSPGNVLFSAAGKPLLSDLGFGLLLGQAGEDIAGTPGYFSPGDGREQASGEQRDVSSLAAVGWFALTGKPPPPVKGRPPLNSMLRGVPSELAAALEAGLDPNPMRRPTAAAFAQAVYRSARAEALMLAHTVHPSVLPDLPTRRHAPSGGARRRGGIGAPRWGRLMRGGRRPAFWTSRIGAVRPSPRSARVKLGLILVAVLALLAAGAAVAGRVAGQPGAGAADDEVRPSIFSAEQVDYGRAWMKGLPEDVRVGLDSSDPATALSSLAWLRAQALTNVNQDLLRRINAPSSAALAGDLSIIDSLRETGHSYSGLNSTIEALEVQMMSKPAADSGTAADPARVVVRAVVTTSSYSEQDAQGQTMFQSQGEKTQNLKFALVRDDARWVIEQVLVDAS